MTLTLLSFSSKATCSPKRHISPQKQERLSHRNFVTPIRQHDISKTTSAQQTKTVMVMPSSIPLKAATPRIFLPSQPRQAKSPLPKANHWISIQKISTSWKSKARTAQEQTLQNSRSMSLIPTQLRQPLMTVSHWTKMPQSAKMPAMASSKVMTQMLSPML